MRIVVVSIAGIFGMPGAVSGVNVVTAGSAGFGRCRGKPEHLRERGRPVREEHSRERRRRCTEERREERKPCNRSKPNHFLLFILTRERRGLHAPTPCGRMQKSAAECAGSQHRRSRTQCLIGGQTPHMGGVSAQQPANPESAARGRRLRFSRTLPLPRRRSTRSAHCNGPPHSRQRP